MPLLFNVYDSEKSLPYLRLEITAVESIKRIHHQFTYKFQER